MNNFDKLLARINRTQNFFALCFFYGGIYKSTDYAEVYVSLKKGHFYGLNGVIYVLFGNCGLSGHKTKCIGYFFSQLIKHCISTVLFFAYMVKCYMEYSQERFTLNKFCEFKRREVEAEFMEHEKTTTLTITRILTLFMGVTFAAFIILDHYQHGTEASFTISLVLRASALCITILAFFLAGKFKRYDQTLLMITLTELSVFAIYLVILYNQTDTEPFRSFITVKLLILGTFLIPNKWKNCLIAACIMLISYIVFCALFIKPTTSPYLVQQGIYFGLCIIPCAIFIFGREGSERKHFASEQRLEFLSMTDRLTGIYNRSRFDYILNLWIKNMRHDPFCLLLFDIDKFKMVNDRFGHNVGDQVLVKMTEIVSANIRDNDIFARWGGEEFVVLFGNTSIKRATELAERLRKAVKAHSYGEAGQITISIGVAKYHRGETSLDLVDRADGKMYEAKKAGRDLVIAENCADDSAEEKSDAC